MPRFVICRSQGYRVEDRRVIPVGYPPLLVFFDDLREARKLRAMNGDLVFGNLTSEIVPNGTLWLWGWEQELAKDGKTYAITAIRERWTLDRNAYVSPDAAELKAALRRMYNLPV